MRFEELYGRQQAGRLTQEEMAEVLNVDVRTARRWMRRFEDEGLDGLIDRRIGQISARRAAVDQVMRVEILYRERYLGFNAKHFHEKLTEVHRVSRSYTWTQRVLQRAAYAGGAPALLGDCAADARVRLPDNTFNRKCKLPAP